MTELAHSSSMLRHLTEQESALLKKSLIDIFTDVDDLCRRNNLTMMLIGGSALGAVRHHGFIPWDDDLDVALSREDYDKLIGLLENGALNKKYEFTVPGKNRDSKNLFLKIYLRNTLNVEISDLYSPFPKGLFLDVFPIENVPKPGFCNTLKSSIVKITGVISSSSFYHTYKSQEFKTFMYGSSDGKKRYRLRKVIGIITSPISHQKWVYWFDKFYQSKKETGFVSIPTGRKGLKGETLEKSVMFPPQEISFENITAKVPNNCHEYLKNLYGDYMSIPPVEKRERHCVVKFKI